MPTSTTWTSDGVEWRLSGVVEFGEIEAANAAFYADPRSDRAKYQLIDLRAVDEFRVTAYQLEQIAAFDNAQSLSTPSLKLAFIVADDAMAQTLTPYVDSLTRSSWRARLFRNETAARAWIEQS